jgi:hypothetical protein
MTSPAMPDLVAAFMACLPADVSAELQLGSRSLALVQELPSYSQQYGREPKNWVVRATGWRRLGETLCEAPYLQVSDLYAIVYALGISLVYKSERESWEVEEGVPHYWSENARNESGDD